MFPSFIVVVHVNNSLSGGCFFLASRLTIVSLDEIPDIIKEAISKLFVGLDISYVL